MRVLASTSETQGDQPGDYHWTCDGELVRLPLADCDNRECGCSRGFAGLTSHRATTTAEVQERTDLDADAYLALVRADIIEDLRSGGIPFDAEVARCVGEELDFLDTVLSIFPVGTIVGRSGTHVLVRRPPAGMDAVRWQ